MKTCNKCKENKPFESFYRDKQANDGRKYTCKDCQKNRDKQYRQNGGHKKLINQNHKPWFQCSSCLASIGLGHKKAAQILANVSHGQIYIAWRRGGVVVQAPACGSWRIYANRMKKGRPTDSKLTKEQILYERARMQDIKTTAKWGFTWIYEWHKEQSRRKSLERYYSMTKEERDEHNKRCAANHKKRMANNPEAQKRQLKNQEKWRKKNPDKQRECVKKSIAKRKKNDPGFKMQLNMRRRYRDIMKLTRNGGSTRHIDDLGCSTKEFNKIIEAKFTNGMTWDNYGTYWHLDHILPCAIFDHQDEKQRKQCWHWTNFQPLEAAKNMAKSDKIENPQMKLLIDYA